MATLDIKKLLERDCEVMLELIGHKNPLKSLILTHGKKHTAAPFKGKMMKPKECFPKMPILWDAVQCA